MHDPLFIPSVFVDGAEEARCFVPFAADLAHEFDDVEERGGPFPGIDAEGFEKVEEVVVEGVGDCGGEIGN